MMTDNIVVLHILGITLGMVGDKDDKRIVPNREPLQFLYKVSYTAIGISYRVQILILQPVHGNIERFVAA